MPCTCLFVSVSGVLFTPDRVAVQTNTSQAVTFFLCLFFFVRCKYTGFEIIFSQTRRGYLLYRTDVPMASMHVEGGGAHLYIFISLCRKSSTSHADLTCKAATLHCAQILATVKTPRFGATTVVNNVWETP